MRSRYSCAWWRMSARSRLALSPSRSCGTPALPALIAASVRVRVASRFAIARRVPVRARSIAASAVRVAERAVMPRLVPSTVTTSSVEPRKILAARPSRSGLGALAPGIRRVVSGELVLVGHPARGDAVERKRPVPTPTKRAIQRIARPFPVAWEDVQLTVKPPRPPGAPVTGGGKTQRVFSGIQPTGKLHLGNYIGALSVWTANQARYDNIFCIVDLHSLTIPEAIRAEALRAARRELAALLLACGIDPARSALFLQSHVPAHAELAWLLACVTPVGWLERMTQYKSKAAALTTVGTGLLEYPVLQAADILLYQADLVPAGDIPSAHVWTTVTTAPPLHYPSSNQRTCAASSSTPRAAAR